MIKNDNKKQISNNNNILSIDSIYSNMSICDLAAICNKYDMRIKRINNNVLLVRNWVNPCLPIEKPLSHSFNITDLGIKQI